MSDVPTYPTAAGGLNSQPHLVIAPVHKDETTGALWVHKDYVQVRKDWETEAHDPQPSGSLRFGDVESWVEYVEKYGYGGDGGGVLLTWNAAGFRAVLDHHRTNGAAVAGGRDKWTASHPFELSPEWRAWQAIANGQPTPHRAAIEKLEDRALDIVDPLPTNLMELLRSLRASVNAAASTELRPDGTTSVSFQQDAKVKGVGNLDLPPEFAIAIRVLMGHVDDGGKPVLYRLPVRLRVSVDDQAHLAFRFAIPTAERVLEDVYADRLALARTLLGERFTLLRTAGS